MDIGIGLPSQVPGTPGVRLLEWSRRAEGRGFSALATLDRIVFPSFDSLASLAAAAGATSRIGLTTNILLAPAYPPVLLAKTAASIDQLSGGRLTLGLAPGGREDDFVAAGRDFHTRGRDFDLALETMHRVWKGEPVGDAAEAACPVPVRGDRVPVLIGGGSDNAMRRGVDWAAGWTMGAGTAEMAGPAVERARKAWSDAGRAGEPRLAALTYYSLGAEAESDSRRYLLGYYAFLGEYAARIAESALRSETALSDTVGRFEAVGVTELYFQPTTPSLDQVDRLADAVL